MAGHSLEYIPGCHPNKDIQFFSQNLVDLSLQADESNEKNKRYYLILKVAVPDFESCFSFLIFSNSYPVISIGEIQLSIPLSIV